MRQWNATDRQGLEGWGFAFELGYAVRMAWRKDLGIQAKVPMKAGLK
jgi:hypothetical protein